MTFADKVTRFIKELSYTGGQLPPGIRVMNPYREFESAMGIAEAFYYKYYSYIWLRKVSGTRILLDTSIFSGYY